MSEKFWRLLNPGEIIQEGDQIFTIGGTWRNVSICIGSNVSDQYICIRRQIVFWQNDTTIKSGTFESGTWAGCSYEVVDGMFELQNVFVGDKKLRLKIEDI